MGWGRPYRERKNTDWGNPRTVFPDHLPMSEPSVRVSQDIAWEHLPDGTVIDCRPGTLHVFDGDTVWMADGRNQGRAEFRLLGLAAPEVAHRKGANDLHVERGRMAAVRLADLLAARAATLVLGHGDDGQPMHRARRFATLLLDGEDLADIACGEGWAARWVRGGHEPKWNTKGTPFSVPDQDA
jgi:endonuclease YncB( thermonuclease family)